MSKRFLLLLTAALLAGPARGEIPAEQDSCLGCHGSDPSMSMNRGEFSSFHPTINIFSTGSSGRSGLHLFT